MLADNQKTDYFALYLRRIRLLVRQAEAVKSLNTMTRYR